MTPTEKKNLRHIDLYHEILQFLQNKVPPSEEKSLLIHRIRQKMESSNFLSSTQRIVVRVLLKDGPMTRRQLVEKVGVDPATLERRSFFERLLRYNYVEVAGSKPGNGNASILYRATGKEP